MASSKLEKSWLACPMFWICEDALCLNLEGYKTIVYHYKFYKLHQVPHHG